MTQAPVLYPEQGLAISADLEAAGLSKRRAALMSKLDRALVTNLANGVATANEETFRRLAAGIQKPGAAERWQKAKERDKARETDAGAPEVARPAPAATFRPDDPAAEGVSVPRVPEPADRDRRLGEADALRALVREALRAELAPYAERLAALEARVMTEAGAEKLKYRTPPSP